MLHPAVSSCPIFFLTSYGYYTITFPGVLLVKLTCALSHDACFHGPKEFGILLTCANLKGLCVGHPLKNNFDYSFLKFRLYELSFTIRAYKHQHLRIYSN